MLFALLLLLDVPSKRILALPVAAVLGLGKVWNLVRPDRGGRTQSPGHGSCDGSILRSVSDTDQLQIPRGSPPRFQPNPR